jgi:hypothetical protein
MTALRWLRLTAAALLYLALDLLARLGARLAKRALRLDLRIDKWRHELQRRPGTVRAVTVLVESRVQHGATSGEERYDYLDDGDVAVLARAIDNLGCYVTVWPRCLQWRRRDVKCSGARLGLHALAPADRDAWADAIANLDGEDGQ